MQKLTRFPHQVVGSNFIASHGSCALFMGARTGKSFTVIDGCNLRNRQVVLIVCPANVIPAWEDILLNDGVDPSKICTIHKRGKTIKQIKNLLMCPTPKYFIINYEKMKESDALNIRLRGPQCYGLNNWDAIIADESYRISNSESQITDYLLRYPIPSGQDRFGLTGTPGQPIHYISQFMFIYGHYFGETSVGDYLIKYWWYDKEKYLWIVKDKQHLKDIHPYIQKNAYCVTMEQLDLGCKPFYSRRRIQLNNQQLDLIFWIRNANTYTPKNSDKEKLLIPPVRTIYERMIAVGIHPLTHEVISENKILDIIDIYEADKKPVLVVSFFKPILYRLKQRLEEKGYSCGLIVGGMDKTVVENIRKEFQDGVIDIVVAQIGPIKESKDFSRLDKIIHLSNSLSQNDTIQVRERGNNLNRSIPYAIIDLISDGTTELRLSKLLESKQKITEQYITKELNTEILNQGVNFGSK